MTFAADVVRIADRLHEPLAALTAIADMDLTSLPGEDQAQMLALLRELAGTAAGLTAELRLTARCGDAAPVVSLDLREVQEPTTETAA